MPSSLSALIAWDQREKMDPGRRPQGGELRSVAAPSFCSLAYLRPRVVELAGLPDGQTATAKDQHFGNLDLLRRRNAWRHGQELRGTEVAHSFQCGPAVRPPPPCTTSRR